MTLRGDRELRFLDGGGEMGELMRAYPWEKSPLGRPQDWPQSLKTTVRLLLTSRHPMFIWWGSELIQFYNDAYRQTMGPERHPSALGQPGRECWQEIWDIIGPQIDYVMRGEGATWNEDQHVPVTRFGKRQDVWWTYGYSPIDDGDGDVGGVLVVCTDVTETHLASDRMRSLVQQAPGFVAILRGPDHVFELCNEAYLRLVGGRDVVGRSVAEALPEVVDQGFVRILDEVFASGEPYSARGVPVDLMSAAGELERRFVDFVYQPIFGVDGSVEQIFALGDDVTEEKRAAEHRKMLADELSHRMKNMLAIVQGIASQSLRDDADPQSAREAFSARIRALARSQDVLTSDRWRGADIVAVVGNALVPHADRRITHDGPSLMLSSRIVTGLTLTLHELATNAMKYGALSVPDGHVDVTWSVELGEDSERHLSIVWQETGGPAVFTPKRAGFGTRLIRSGLGSELGGGTEIIYDPRGLICRIEAVLGPRDT